MGQQFKNYSLTMISLVLALFCRVFLVSVYKIPTDSMSPTLMTGDFIISSQISYGLKFPWSEGVLFKNSPQKGDLVVVYFKNKPNIPYIKRITAVSGEEVQLDSGKVKVPDNEVFVVSDNPQIKQDSREFGTVSVDQIESRPKLVWFSFSEEKTIRWDRLFKFLK